MKRFLREDLAALSRVCGNDMSILETAFEQALESICTALATGRKVIAFGNGGSASDAEHLVGELVGRFGYDRAPLPGISLSVPSATFTAIANDYGYEKVFERQILGLGKPGDVAIGITTSGNSPNVISALEAAEKAGLITIAMTGSAESACSRGGHICLRVPSLVTARVQEIHAIIIHSLCRGIEARLFPRPDRQGLPARKLVKADEIDRLATALKIHETVFTNGCFDILHPGHVALLQKARSFGELLIVGVNTDGSVKRLGKGANRPFHSLDNRMTTLAAMACVDYVLAFDEDTPLELIKRLTPKVLVKGGDYTRSTVVGADHVEKNGGRVEIIPLVAGHSTTRILETERDGVDTKPLPETRKSVNTEGASSLRVIGIVPARLASTRLPEKMLADIAGRPLIVWTAESAMKSGIFNRVVVATDHDRIAVAVRNAGYDAVITDPELPSGSARAAAVASGIEDADVIVNIQGDEPLIDGEGLRRIVRAFADDPTVEMATLSFPLSASDEANPNAVKVVVDARGDAIYFSRSLIPFPRFRKGFTPLKHIGVYAYKRDTLLRLIELPACDIEAIESLEQLRALYNGIKIRVIPAAMESLSVDTIEDLARVREVIERMK
ncbi:MAG: 3-deoxy-manno-octulosonate cytidylyltransferase [Candidatus Riflebacteria bacterium]|nr:3-deoxy-manno-octulosonate cytidylyltransferase [Candidatus Riflebacteria bacterium]